MSFFFFISLCVLFFYLFFLIFFCKLYFRRYDRCHLLSWRLFNLVRSGTCPVSWLRWLVDCFVWDSEFAPADFFLFLFFVPTFWPALPWSFHGILLNKTQRNSQALKGKKWNENQWNAIWKTKKKRSCFEVVLTIWLFPILPTSHIHLVGYVW